MFIKGDYVFHTKFFIHSNIYHGLDYSVAALFEEFIITFCMCFCLEKIFNITEKYKITYKDIIIWLLLTIYFVSIHGYSQYQSYTFPWFFALFTISSSMLTSLYIRKKTYNIWLVTLLHFLHNMYVSNYRAIDLMNEF